MFKLLRTFVLGPVLRWIFRLVIPTFADLAREGFVWLMDAIIDFWTRDPSEEAPEFFVAVPIETVSHNKEKGYAKQIGSSAQSELGTPFFD